MCFVADKSGLAPASGAQQSRGVAEPLTLLSVAHLRDPGYSHLLMGATRAQRATCSALGGKGLLEESPWVTCRARWRVECPSPSFTQLVGSKY